MAISRDAAFGVFEALLEEGLRPVLTGFRSQGDHNSVWPKGTEGFFVHAHFQSTTRLGLLIADLQTMHDIAEKHGLKAWFSGREYEFDGEDDGSSHEFRVVFEKS